jgi:hypothetical protein
MPEQYSTVTTSIQKLLPLHADWLQHRSYRSWLKKGSNADFLTSANRTRIELEQQLWYNFQTKRPTTEKKIQF